MLEIFKISCCFVDVWHNGDHGDIWDNEYTEDIEDIGDLGDIVRF